MFFLGFFRALASLVLGVVIFFGFVGYLMVSAVRDSFLTTEFYTESLSENDVYARIYDDVLIDPEFRETTDELLGGIDFGRVEGDLDAEQRDIIRVTREIIPPDYLQDQVEAAVGTTIRYLNKETDEPNLYIDLGPPLGRVKPELFAYMDERIDGLTDVPVTTIDELEEELDNLFRTIEDGQIPTTVPFIEDPDALVESYVDDTIGELTVVPAATREDFEVQLQDIYVDLSNGQLPTTLPSIEAIPVDERLAAYDQVIAAIRGDPRFPQEALQGLEEQEQAIKAKLREPEGDVRGALEVATKPLTAPAIELFVDDAYDMAFETLSNDPDFPQNALDGLDAQSDLVKQHIGEGRIKDALKAGARGLAAPLIDEKLDELRDELAPGDLLDLVEKGAEQNGQTKAEFLDDLDIVRDAIDRAQDYWVAILVMVVAGVFMAAVHFPHAASALRWPGMTSLMIGVVFLILGLVMNYTLSDLFNDLIDRSAEGISSPIPNSLIDVISDVLTTMASDLVRGLIIPSIVLIVVGILLIIASRFVRALHIPFFSR